MAELLQALGQRWRSAPGRLELAAMALIGLCASAIVLSILINFLEAKGARAKTVKHSIVATGTMSLFFVGFYLLIRFHVGALEVPSLPLRVGLVIVGLGLIVFGCAVNIAGRLRLGRNWANQVTIYHGQQLVTTGVYRLVRHPLYASLIWMFYGASLVYANVAAFLANTAVFLPFMAYRARQEEKLLLQEFKEYAQYQAHVGMFF
jgi:protein-S-isoprenylcysteine O-methyltransferase Ste14